MLPIILFYLMAQIGSYVYLIDFKDGSEQEVLTKKELQDTVDDIYENVSKIIKQYKLQNNGKKKKINMTLYLESENFSASEYIEHYKSLDKQEYGSNFLSDFDIELISMFN